MNFRQKYILALILSFLVIPLIWIFKNEIRDLLNIIRLHAEALGKINPVLLIVGIGILPAVGLPAFIFYVIGSIAYGIAWGLIFSGIGIAINISLCYWIANSFLRRWVLQLCYRQGHRVCGSEVNAIIVTVCAIPWIPLCVQNYTLSMIGIPFGQYFIISWLIQMFNAILFVLTANAIIHQTTESFILLIVGLLAVSLFAKVFRNIYRCK